MAKDICDVLGLSDVSMSVATLDDDEKLTQVMFVSGQRRCVWLINEPGLYSLILRSRKPRHAALNTIRVIEKDGDPWWVAKDICDVLDLTNPTMAISELDEDERAKYCLGRQGETNIINEPGLYSLILRSRKPRHAALKPEAKAFKRWITHEVIPAIRKHDRRARTLNKPQYFIWMITLSSK